MAACAVTVFLSAFLLFLLQPIIARFVLPWYGGAAAVWTVCLLFFQTTLLAGYAYAASPTGVFVPIQAANRDKSACAQGFG